MKTTREMCGCHLLEQLKRCPPSSGNAREDAANLAVDVDFAKEQQARWGCPAAGFTPPATLPPDLAGEARHVATMTDTPPSDTCPFACVERASPWVVELTHAVSLNADLNIPLETSLGRDLTAADLTALQVLKRAQNDALRSDQEIAQQKREAEEADRRARAAQGGNGY